VVTEIVDTVQWFCVFCVQFIVVRATLDIVQWSYALCGVYCGFSNCSYSAIVMSCVWRLLWLQQH